MQRKEIIKEVDKKIDKVRLQHGEVTNLCFILDSFFIKQNKMSILPKKIVDKMYEKDAFSQWLGIEIQTVTAGFCTLKMTLRPEMLNGFGIVHGGISYSFADSALAFACNSQGKQAVSVETSISHLQKLKAGETIFAEAKEESCSHKIGVYQVRVTKEDGTLVALFKGTVYRSSRDWEV